MIIGRCACSLQIDPSLNGYEKNITREILLEYMHVLYTTYLHYDTLYKYFQLYNTESPSVQNSNLILIYIMKLPNICLRSHCYKKCQTHVCQLKSLKEKCINLRFILSISITVGPSPPKKNFLISVFWGFFYYRYICYQ